MYVNKLIINKVESDALNDDFLKEQSYMLP